MTVVVDEIDWGDCPDWRDRLAAARKPVSAAQRAWDVHYASQQSIARHTERNPNRAAAAAWARTEAQYGQRPDNEETT